MAVALRTPRRLMVSINHQPINHQRPHSVALATQILHLLHSGRMFALLLGFIHDILQIDAYKNTEVCTDVRPVELATSTRVSQPTPR